MKKDWKKLEQTLKEAFADMKRKSGDPLHVHSIGVGRKLIERGSDDITIFAGYCHDLWEDTDCSWGDVLNLALEYFDFDDALEAVWLVRQVSYSEDEYKLPKDQRKKSAVARWMKTDDIRVAQIKAADIDDNEPQADAVNAAFAEKYRSWALPLREYLRNKWGF